MRNLVTNLAVATFAGGVMWAANSRGQAPAPHLGALLAARERGATPTPNEVWVLFRLGDCHLTSAPFDSLNAFHARSGVRVVGVMLDPPKDSADATRAVLAFHAKFPVLLDRDSTFSRTLRENRLGNPLYAVMQYGTLVATMNPAASGSIVQILPVLPSEPQP